MTGHEQDDDVVAVGRFIDTHRAAQAAAQRTGRARDDVAQVHLGVRLIDRAGEAAQARLAKVAAAQELAAERAETVEAFRDQLAAQTRDRELARGRGPAARIARTRLAASAHDAGMFRERIAELDGKVAGAAAELGTVDPAEWSRLRAADEATLADYRQRRAEAIAASSERYPAAVAAYEQAQAGQQAALDQRESAAADLMRRGLDPDRIAAAAERSQPPEPQAGPTSEAWQERVRYEQRAAELDAERGCDRDR